MLLDFDVDFPLLPTAPDEVLGLLLSVGPAIVLMVNRPFVAVFPATARADFSASLRVMFPHAGGVLIDLYLIAGMGPILSRTRANVKKSN